MDEHTKYAFSSASDTSKQLITLSTGLLALELTFIKNIAPNPSHVEACLLELSWVCFFISIIAGVITLMALTGSAAQSDSPCAKTIYNNNIKVPSLVQVIFFLLGILLSVIFAIVGI